MSIDYDRLRELLEQWQHGDELRDQLEAQWDMELAAPDMARELLRLRDGVERAVNTAKRQIALSIKAGHVEENGPTCPALANLTDLTSTLTDLLNGDAE